MDAVLATPIWVVNQSLTRTFGGQSPTERLADQVSGQPVFYVVANDITGEKVFVTGKIQPALIGG